MLRGGARLRRALCPKRSVRLWTHTLAPILPDTTPPTDLDREVIEKRQLRHRTPVSAVGQRCRHGHPQAFVLEVRDQPSLHSALCRLSCPLLVQAIDEWEKHGGVAEVTKAIKASPELTAEFYRINRIHRAARLAALTPQDRTQHSQSLPPATLHAILESGMAGISPHQPPDAKCLHAHVADFLCRAGDNAIGEFVLEGLKSGSSGGKGVPPRDSVDVHGIAQCRAQCDTSTPLEDVEWLYVPQKNRQRLRTRRERGRARRGARKGDGVEGR